MKTPYPNSKKAPQASGQTERPKAFPWPFRLPVLLLMALSFFLSSRSRLPAMPSFSFADKVAHFCLFAVLAACWTPWFFPGFRRAPGKNVKARLRIMLACAALASLYGIVDEVHQYFVPGRSCDIFDWIADSLGAVLGSAAGYYVLNFFAADKKSAG